MHAFQLMEFHMQKNIAVAVINNSTANFKNCIFEGNVSSCYAGAYSM